MRSTPCLTAVLAALITVAPAQAASVQDVFDRINQYLAPLGAEVVAALPEKSKSSMVRAEDVALQAELGPPIPLTELLVLTPPKPLESGALLVEQAGLMEFSRDANGLRISFGSLNWNNLLLPAATETNPLIWAQMPGGFELTDLSVEFAGERFAVDKASLVVLPRPEIGTPDPSELWFTIKLEGVLINPSLLGLTSFEFPGIDDRLTGSKLDLYLGMRWDTAAGTLSVEPFRVDVPDRASWLTSLQFGGLSKALFQEIVAFVSEQAASTTGGMVETASPDAFGLSLLSQLTLVSGVTILDDKGLVQAAVSEHAERMDTSETESRDSAIAEVRVGLPSLGLPQEFVDGTADSLLALSEDGGSISLSAAPEVPATFIEIVALAQAPAALVQRLGLKVQHRD